MINLLKETLGCLSENGKTPSDVVYVVSAMISTRKEYEYIEESQLPYGKFSWEQFKEKAAHFRYNNGFGAPEVDLNLKIVGNDWWLERAEYDGSEWWEYKSIPDIKNLPSIDARVKPINLYED